MHYYFLYKFSYRATFSIPLSIKINHNSSIQLEVIVKKGQKISLILSNFLPIKIIYPTSLIQQYIHYIHGPLTVSIYVREISDFFFVNFNFRGFYRVNYGDYWPAVIKSLEKDHKVIQHWYYIQHLLVLCICIM